MLSLEKNFYSFYYLKLTYCMISLLSSDFQLLSLLVWIFAWFTFQLVYLLVPVFTPLGICVAVSSNLSS